MALATYDYSNGKESRNQQATVWIGGLEAQCTEELVWELMCQAGPVVSVNMPRDKITQTHNGYAFCEFVDADTADYAVRITNMLKLYGKQLRVNKAAMDQKDQPDQGFSANLFVGNLDPDMDEKTLYDTFSQFGAVLSVKIMVDPETGKPKGFGFVSFDTFEAADAAIENMNNAFLNNRSTHCSYAYKKDGTKGERHGSESERLLAKQSSMRNIRPKAISMLSAGGGFGMGMPVGMGRPPPVPMNMNMNVMHMGQMGMGGMPGIGRGLPPMPPMPPPGLPQQPPPQQQQFRPPPLPSADGRFPFPPPPSPFGQMPPMPGGMSGMPPQRPPNFPPPWMQMRPPPMMPGGGPPPFMPPFRPPPLPDMRSGMPPHMPPSFFGMGPPPNMPGPPPGMPPQHQQQQPPQQAPPPPQQQ